MKRALKIEIQFSYFLFIIHIWNTYSIAMQSGRECGVVVRAFSAMLAIHSCTNTYVVYTLYAAVIIDIHENECIQIGWRLQFFFCERNCERFLLIYLDLCRFAVLRCGFVLCELANGVKWNECTRSVSAFCAITSKSCFYFLPSWFDSFWPIGIFIALSRVQ